MHDHLMFSGGLVFMEMKEAIGLFSEWRSFKVNPKGLRGYDTALRHFCMYLRNPGIEKITVSEVTEYLRTLEDMGWKQNSLSVTTTAIRKFFEFYRKQGYKVIHEELVPFVHKEVKLPKVATEEEYQKLLRLLSARSKEPEMARDRALIMLLHDTGARNGEICRLNESDIKHKHALIKTEKARRTRPWRKIFWSEATNNQLKRWIDIKNSMDKEMVEPQALFVSCGKNPVRRMNINRVQLALAKRCRQAGIRKLNPHSFRHKLARDIIKKGGSNSDVANILGHASIGTTFVYTMMEGVDLEQQYRKFRND